MKHCICIFSLLVLLAMAGNGCAAPAAVGISKLGYSIQVGAFAEVKNAERLTALLQTQGVDAFFFKKENGMFAVRFGDYSTRKAAREAAKKITAEHGIDSFFIAPPLKAPLTVAQDPATPHRPEKPVRKPERGDMGSIAARTAERFVGIPYLWGGNTVVDGMDCSGFVRAVYNLCGVNIPRTSAEQFRVGRDIPMEELSDGDLVFFGSSEQKITHVGIYVGSKKFVHAPKRGEEIKISPLDGGYGKKFVGARRYL